MKNLYKLLSVVGYSFISYLSMAGASGGWTAKFEPEKVFIANKGQFHTQATPGFDSKVEYAYDGNGQNFYFFTRSGVIFQLVDMKKPKDNEREKEKEEREMKERAKKGIPKSADEHQREENEERRMIITKDILQAQWLGANANVQIIPEEEQSAYYSYSFKEPSGTMINESNIPGFKKLTYKDLYPNIDVVYEMHPNGGIKYSVVVHPGGDISKVKLQYSKKARLTANGDVKTKSVFGDFIDHAPATFYADDKSPIVSKYELNNGVISFAVTNPDPSRTVVIDPWTQTPPFNTQWRCAWECERDASGNAYVIGGQMPMQLLKYNSSGALQWTYNTPYDTANFWLGTFAVDNGGNSYVAGGSPAAMVKVSTTGSVVWNNASPGGISTGNLLIEWWSISFNCDQTQLVVGGTAGSISPLPEIYNIDLASGNVISSAQVTGGGIISPQEVRAITAAKNSKYYYLTHDSIGWIHQGLNSCVYPFYTNSGTSYSYNCSNFRANNNGICAIKSQGDFVYTHRGDRIEKRAFNTAAIVATATIPGGAYTVSLGSGQVSNSGIDIDSCGNIFVGSTNGVVKFNTNLTQLASYPTSFNVYDVAISPTGDLIVAGSTGTSSTNGARTGYLQSIPVNACQTIVNICCDPSICPHPPVCISAAPFNFTALTGGGTWSGIGITNSSTGTFSPSVSGIGTFTIYYTLPCGTDSTVISVNSCTATSVCRNANGTLTVSGGTGPYTWSVIDSTGQTCVGGIVLFGICTGTWETIRGWTTFATGATVTPPAPVATDTIKVVDNAGTTITINNVSSVPPCNACNLAATISPTNPTCAPNSGSATANVTAGTGTSPYHYHWNTGVAADTFATLSNVGAGTYIVTVTDANGCTTTATVTLTVSGTLPLTTSSTPATCGGSNGSATVSVTGGSGTYTYTWSVAGSTATINNLPTGNYTVTVTQGGCSGVTSVSVASSNGVSASLGPKTDVKCHGASTGVAHINATGGTLPYTYTWAAPAVSTVDSATGLAAGAYSVTVKDANNCTSLVTFTISQPATSVSATDSTKPAYCGNNNGKIYVIPAGGTPGYTYTWSPNVSTNDSAIGLAVNTYLVTVADANLCTTSLSINVVAAAGPSISLASKKDVSCHGGSDGKIFTTTTGGTGPYTYTWSPAVSTRDSAVGLAQGSYTVVVHDANGCTATLSVTINQPAAMQVTTTTIQANCGVSDGSATASVTGGVNPFTYQWSVGTSTTAVDSGLPAGTYTVIVTDSNHCTATGTAAISNFGAPVASIASQINDSCHGGNNGKIVLSIVGGTPAYSYTWAPNVSTVDSAMNLTAGTYNVTVHDASSCIAVISATIMEPSALSATTQFRNADCGLSDGWAQVMVSGGSGHYTYTWTSTAQTTDSITGLTGGIYYVTVTDSMGCTLRDSVIVGTNAGPSAPTITAGGPSAFCQGGSVVLTSSAATGNTWSTTATTQSITVSSSGSYTVTQTVGGCTSPPSAAVLVTVNPIPPAPTITASGPLSFCQGGSVNLSSSSATSNLWSDGETAPTITVSSAGTFTVSDTVNGCPSTASAPVSVSIIVAPQPVIVANHPAICQDSSVTLDATTASATSYLWSTTATQPSITVTTPGFYEVTVTVNGCTGTDTMTIFSQPSLGDLTLTDDTICPGDFVTIDATTANATSYVWAAPLNATTPIVTVDSQGVYSITVTNSCGTRTGSVTVSLKDCECKMVMPNAFTPNGDQVNDTYKPDFKCDNPKLLLFRIFNRWGEKVFETTDLGGEWNGMYRGTMQPPGIYIYYVEFTGLQNNVEKTVKMMGGVTLIR